MLLQTDAFTLEGNYPESLFGQLHQNIKEKKKEECENLWLETVMQIISFFISIIFKHHPAAENKACEIRATFRGSLLAGGTLRRFFDIKHVIYLISLHGRNTTSGQTSKRNIFPWNSSSFGKGCAVLPAEVTNRTHQEKLLLGMHCIPKYLVSSPTSLILLDPSQAAQLLWGWSWRSTPRIPVCNRACLRRWHWRASH